MMETEAKKNASADFNLSYKKWEKAYEKHINGEKPVQNRSGITIHPLYTPADPENSPYMDRQGFPGEYPYTRGIYPTMHRGRTWSQRQLIGLGTPDHYNERVLKLLYAGASAISLLPCCSGFRGQDCDEIQWVLLGTCGTVVNTVDHMDTCLSKVPIEKISTSMNDPSPSTI
jgi:methylmalonyl-CoA mutase N-terminal domain/subunit